MSTRIDTLKEEIESLQHRNEFSTGWCQHIDSTYPAGENFSPDHYEIRDKLYKLKKEIEGNSHLIESKKKEIAFIEKATDEAKMIKEEYPKLVEELESVKMMEKADKTMFKGIKDRLAVGYTNQNELVTDYKNAQILKQKYNILNSVK